MHKHAVLLVGENTWLIRALRLLIAGDSDLLVAGSCAVRDVIQTTLQLSPQVVVFLPEVSLLGSELVFLDLRRLFPHLFILLVTPVDAQLYETTAVGKPIDGFITQSRLNVDLVPRIHSLASQFQDDKS